MLILISIEEEKELLNNLINNSLDTFTINCIIKYANISTDIFNIDHNLLIKNLSSNLKNNIVLSKKFNNLSNILGFYDYESKQIYINSKVANKQYVISLIFHELDHASNYQKLNLEDKLQYLDTYLQNLKEKYPFVQKVPFAKNILKNKFLKSNCFSCGFNNAIIVKALDINLNFLKEGFTTYKQSKYEEYLNLSDSLTCKDNSYKNEMKVAKVLIETIGEDTVMQLEQHNDILELKEIFEKITQKQISFEDLIKQLNKTRVNSIKILENQQILDTMLKKIFLFRKAYDYGLVFDSNVLTLSQLQDLIASFEQNLEFQKKIKVTTYKNLNKINFKNNRSIEDTYIK